MRTHILKQLAIDICKERDSLADIGLINGKFGACINLFHLSKLTNDKNLEQDAEDLLDSILKEVNLSLRINLSKGLSGIGWGIEHLIKQKLVEGEADQINEEIDMVLVDTVRLLPYRFCDFEEGFLGILEYITMKLENASDENTVNLLEMKISIISFVDDIKTKIMGNPYLFQEPEKLNIYWNLPSLLHIILKVYNANIFNSQINICIELLLHKLTGFSARFHFHNLLLAYAIKCLSAAKKEIDFDTIYNSLINNLSRESIYKEYKESDAALIPEILKIYHSLCFEYNCDSLISEYNYWIRELKLYLESITTDCKKNEVNVRIKKLGLFDGYKGFHTIHSILNQQNPNCLIFK